MLFGALLIVTQSIAQDKIHWMTIEEAQEAVKKEPKKILIDVYTDWCGRVK